MLAGQRTLLISRHRPSTIRACDVIHLIEYCSVAAGGSYQGLFAPSPGFGEFGHSTNYCAKVFQKPSVSTA